MPASIWSVSFFICSLMGCFSAINFSFADKKQPPHKRFVHAEAASLFNSPLGRGQSIFSGAFAVCLSDADAAFWHNVPCCAVRLIEVRVHFLRRCIVQPPQFVNQLRVMRVDHRVRLCLIVNDDGFALIFGKCHVKSHLSQYRSSHRLCSRHAAVKPVAAPITVPMPRNSHFISFPPFRSQTDTTSERHRPLKANPC